MKRFSVVFLALLLTVMSGFPSVLSAAKQNEGQPDLVSKKDSKKQDADRKEEYNEHGIKKGTRVHGQDISELTEEELQYIPEGWRDGEVESEHPEPDEPERRIMSTYPDVNHYIESNNLPTAKIEKNHLNHLPKFNYRFGKPEGVVAHETANNTSSINGEISWMTRNYKNAFVHAFIDHNRAIEVHPTWLGAWGAGYYSNQRHIHVELVRVHTFDAFARSMNNYAEYIAHRLHYYGLGVTDAEQTGKGSLWSHDAVSRHLGGTNHVDPHGYFARWGYHWNDFVKLVKKKYDRMDEADKDAGPKIYNTSKLGHIKTKNAEIQSGESPTAEAESSIAAADLMNEVFYIKSEAKLGKDTHYLISREPSKTKGTIGWVNAKDINVHDHKGIDKKKKTFTVKGTGTSYSKAWGGSKDLVHDDLSVYKDELFHVNLTEAVGNNTWYRGELDGKVTWIHESYLNKITESKTSMLGHLKSTDAKVYAQAAVGGADAQIAAKDYTDTVHYIKKQAQVGSEVYYLLSSLPSSTEDVIGWVKAADLHTAAHSRVDTKKKTFFVKGSSTAYDKAWGGKKNTVYSLSEYKGKPFEVDLTDKVGKEIWYRGMLDGKKVWIKADQVTGFTDISSSSSHFEAIYALVNMGAITGYNDNTFRHYEEISRSHTAVIFTGVFDLPKPKNLETVLENFSDVNTEDRYAKQIAATYEADIFRGNNGEFLDGPLTRQQMATVIVKAFDLKDTGEDTAINLDNVSESHKENVKILAQHGITNQLDDYRPREAVTRGQFATFLYKAM